MKTELTNKKYLIILLIVSLGIIGSVALLWRHGHHSPTSPTRQAVIDITPTGFVPATLHVTVGTRIVWQNQDSATHKVGANTYPTDTSVPGLRSGAILPNGSYQFTPTAVGTINYHDDTKPTLNGSVLVSK